MNMMQARNQKGTVMLNQKSLSTEVSGAAEGAFEGTGHALESTRQFASHAMETAGKKIRDLRYGATDLARSGADTVSEATAAAQRRLGQYAHATGRYVSKQPVKSVLVAAAIGAAVAAVVFAMRRTGRES
jgi:ElaB/YqjD/DUF883 family membrane-anchored ribosome-binding protein